MGGWWSTVCSLHKTGLLTYHPPIAHRSSWWMEVFWRYIRPQHRWRKTMGRWIRSSYFEHWSRTGPSHSGQHKDGSKELWWQVLQRKDRSDAGIRQGLNSATNTSHTTTNWSCRWVWEEKKMSRGSIQVSVTKLVFSVWCSVFITKF